MEGRRVRPSTVSCSRPAACSSHLNRSTCERALRRAATAGDGWFSSGTPSFDDAVRLRDRVNELPRCHRSARRVPDLRARREHGSGRPGPLRRRGLRARARLGRPTLACRGRSGPETKGVRGSRRPTRCRTAPSDDRQVTSSHYSSRASARATGGLDPGDHATGDGARPPAARRPAQLGSGAVAVALMSTPPLSDRTDASPPRRHSAPERHLLVRRADRCEKQRQGRASPTR